MDSGTDLRWIKSSYSGGSGTECVEAARLTDCTAVRDSKSPERAHLSFPDPTWADFVQAVCDRRLG
jgi:hypothetical protein